jgi:negative regulator of replication initiation
MDSLTDKQREKTLEMTESAEDILRRARAGMATQTEITAATDALLKQFADENSTRDTVADTVTKKDVTVRKPLKLKAN